MNKENQTVSINPVTQEVLGATPIDSVEDLKQSIQKAREAQETWAALAVQERVKRITPIRRYLVDNAEKLAEIISRDNGKLRIDALASEILPSVMATSFYCRKANTFLKDCKLGTGSLPTINKRSKVVRVPYGVIGIISPWNYPFSIPFYQVIMGLLAGNGVMLKTASETLTVGKALKEVINAADLPEGLFSFINLPGRIAGFAFLEKGVDKLFFTGSVPVGKILMAKAAETLTPINLELGGNDAMIVCEDADLQRAAGGAVWAGLSNAGQSCGGVERVYVHEKVYEPFLEILKKMVESMRVGYDLDFNMDMGAMTTEKQVKSVQMHIDKAVKNGAVIFAESKIPNGEKQHNFLPATVLTNVTHEMDVMRDETFGPVIGVMKVKNNEDAIGLANDSYLGLTGSVWSRNQKRAVLIGRRIKAGAITINDHLMSHGMPETSWGGFKQSGIGRSHGRLGFDEMTQPQMIVSDILPGVKKDLWWHPYDKKIYRGLLGAIHGFYGRGLRKRIRGLIDLSRIILRIFNSQ